MSAEERNAALLRHCYQHWANSKGKSTDAWLSLLAEDMRAHLLGAATGSTKGPSPGSGKAQFRDYLASVDQNWEMLDYKLADTIAQDERVAAIIHTSWRNRATGRAIDVVMVNIWRFRDGKAVEFSEFYDTAHALSATREASETP